MLRLPSPEASAERECALCTKSFSGRRVICAQLEARDAQQRVYERHVLLREPACPSHAHQWAVRSHMAVLHVLSGLSQMFCLARSKLRPPSQISEGYAHR